MKSKLALIIFALCQLWGQAQLATTSNLTVEQYVQDVLLGQNVTVSNITFNGSPANVVSASVGGFDCTNCNLGINSGFAMTTGDIVGLQGPNDEGGYAGTGTGGASGQDPDLLDLIQELLPGSDPTVVDVNDWVIIEFDFVPLGDTLQFQYVWASEEYSEFVGTDFNDIFGFFISGPGINGAYANNAINIARVPGTNAPVAISTINNGPNNNNTCVSCEYFNQDGQYGNIAFDAPEHTDPYYMQLDGYTDILTATAIVQCGETFHIKLAICDTSDPAYASAVFLQRDSFSSNLVVQASLNLAASGPDGNTMFEDCGDGYIVFERPVTGNSNTTLVANLEFTGTATMGDDYTALPSMVTFAPGVMEVSLYIDAFEDGITEGSETISMSITNIAECGESLISSSFEFHINDVPEPLQVQGVNYVICEGAIQTLEPMITGGYANYGYTWSTGETSSTIDVAPITSTTYILTVSDTCGMPSDNSEFIVTVLPATPLIVSLLDTDNILPLECAEFGNIYAIVSGGIQPYQYNWTDDQGNFLWGTDVLNISAWNAGTVNLQVLDECGFQGNDNIFIAVNAPPIVATLPLTHTVVCGDFCDLTPVVSGGDTQGMGYGYQWSLNGNIDWDLYGVGTYNAQAMLPGIISLIVSDNCGQQVEVESQLILESPAIDLTLPQDFSGNCATNFSIEPVILGGSGDPAAWVYNWSANSTGIGTSTTLLSTFATTTSVMLNVTDLCGQTADATTTVVIENPALTVSLGDDINASCIDNSSFTPEINGGSGSENYQWIISNSIEATTPNFSIQSSSSLDVIVHVVDACLESASDTVHISIPDEPLSINFASDTTICPNQTALLWATAQGGEDPYIIRWNDELLGDSIEVTPAGTINYRLVVRDLCGRVQSGNVQVNIHPIVANFAVTSLGDDTYLFSSAPQPECPGCTFYWNFGDGQHSLDSIAIHQYDGLNDYTAQLTVINTIGCVNTQDYLIEGPAFFYVPNSFTPNGDGLNDVFQVVGKSIAEYELTIFNRWGNVIFHSTDPQEVWVGETNSGDFYVPNAAYNYVLRIKGFDTETIQREGNITIMR